jgi:hypothetical protein
MFQVGSVLQPYDNEKLKESTRQYTDPRMWCEQNVRALNFFLQMWQHFRFLWQFGV